MDIEVGEDVRPEPKKKNDKGFTLIELLIVIVILGVLSTVVVLSVGGITDKGKKSSCKSDYNAVATAVEAYNAQTGTYATTMAQLQTGGFLRTVSQKYQLAPSGASSNGAADIDPIPYNATTNPDNCTYDPDDGVLS